MEIPETVRALLWEYETGGSVASRWEDTVLERVMQRGGWAEMRWLLREVDRDRLRDFLARRGRRVLAPRELRFWALMCHVSDDEQDAWVADATRRERAWRG